MPATVVAERIGWSRGIAIWRNRGAELRPLFRPPDLCQRTFYSPGELVLFDLWQPETPIGSIVGGESNDYDSHRYHDRRGCSHENPTR